MFAKSEIAKLSVEQQEILAQLELSKTRRRQQLLELARGLDWRSRYGPFFAFAVFSILMAIYFSDTFQVRGNPAPMIIIVAMVVVSSLIFRINQLNRRVDALLELLDFNRENKDAANSNSKQEKSG